MKVHYSKRDSTTIPGAKLTNCGLCIGAEDYIWDYGFCTQDVRSDLKTTTKRSKVTCKNCLRLLNNKASKL